MYVTDVFQAIAAGLEDNETLVTLNLESNYISGVGIVAILEAINENQTVTELRLTNQVSMLVVFILRDAIGLHMYM